LPCFDLTDFTSSKKESQRAILRYCAWNGLSIPCSAIFKTFPTGRYQFEKNNKDRFFLDFSEINLTGFVPGVIFVKISNVTQQIRLKKSWKS
jgi:hypothetical protein